MSVLPVYPTTARGQPSSYFTTILSLLSEKSPTAWASSGSSSGCIVRVQGREHEVAGERSLHRVLGRLEIADFAHHDDVGVPAQDCTKCAAESRKHPESQD
jgi:hypothetical protein